MTLQCLWSPFGLYTCVVASASPLALGRRRVVEEGDECWMSGKRERSIQYERWCCGHSGRAIGADHLWSRLRGQSDYKWNSISHEKSDVIVQYGQEVRVSGRSRMTPGRQISSRQPVPCRSRFTHDRVVTPSLLYLMPDVSPHVAHICNGPDIIVTQQQLHACSDRFSIPRPRPSSSPD